MKKIFIYAAMAASMVGCVAPKPLPEGREKVEATYMGSVKSGDLWVLKFHAYHHKKRDTLYIQQRIRPRFHMRDVVYLEWNCNDSTELHDIKILKNR